MRRAIATVSLSGTLLDKLEAIAAAGFDAFELFEADFINFRGDARALRRIADDLGLGIDLYQPFRDFEGMPDDLFRRSLDRAERKFDLMQTLGAPLMLVCSNTAAHSLGGAERAAEQLHALAERAARRGLRIGYEALAWGRWVKLYGEAWQIVERANHPNLGLILDSFHTLSLRDDPAGIAAIPGKKIFFLQMADAPLMAMDVLQWARHHRNFPGQGQFDCENFLEQTLRAGYTGTLSLEIFNDVFRATPNRRTALDAMRSLLFLESQVRLRLGPSSDRGDPATDTDTTPDTGSGSRASTPVAGRSPLFDPPAPAPIDVLAFIEFGVDGASARALAELLEQLGFVRYGHHRSKRAALYRQGDILLVLNAQPGSDARLRFDEQGTCVTTIGAATRDPERAARRGRALLSVRRDSPRDAQELAMPAIVAPGGMLVQFAPTGQAIESDFMADDGSTAPGQPAPAAPVGCGLRRIDHVAIGVSSERLDTWTLFARAVLGLAPGDSQELADPFGLIRSNGYANDARTLRLVVNVSSSDRTRSARQASAAGGRTDGRVQHIALACSDIFPTMETLRARGVRFVPISANYYDDLLARLDLDEALVRRMQALDIVYDASADGRFFHAYGESFEDKLFFEIVQRQGYDAYGALNAPARLASQEQRG